MFDFGFSELVVIGLVALVVIGPERLPKVARTVGLLLGRFQRYVTDVKAEINREMQLEDLKKLQQQVQDSARDLERNVRAQVADVQQAAQSVESEVRQTVAAVQQVDAQAADPVVADEPSPQLELHLDTKPTATRSPQA